MLAQSRRTPLHIAAENGHVDCLALLLKARADWKVVDKVCWKATTRHVNCPCSVVPCPTAAEASFQSAALVHRNPVSQFGETALHRAAEKGHVPCVRLLVTAGLIASVRNKVRSGHTAPPSDNSLLLCATQRLPVALITTSANVSY